MWDAMVHHRPLEINISGFASINAGKVLSGTGVPQYGVDR